MTKRRGMLILKVFFYFKCKKTMLKRLLYHINLVSIAFLLTSLPSA